MTFLSADEVRRRDLRPVASVTLTVAATGPEGKPLALADLRLAPPSPWDCSGLSFRVTAGRDRIRARVNGWPIQEREVVLDADAHEEFVFGGGLAVEGCVVARDDSPVPAFVQWNQGGTEGYANSDENGRFRVRLQAGMYVGSAEVAGEWREVVPFVVREGETTHVDLKPK